jgi:hypothetical protein
MGECQARPHEPRGWLGRSRAEEQLLAAQQAVIVREIGAEGQVLAVDMALGGPTRYFVQYAAADAHAIQGFRWGWFTEDQLQWRSP